MLKSRFISIEYYFGLNVNTRAFIVDKMCSLCSNLALSQSTKEIMDLKYNTQEHQILLTEYGRGVQEMIEHLSTIEDREARNRMARTIFRVMVNLNPEIKDQTGYEKTVWDHIHEIGKFELDIDTDYPKPSPAEKEVAPEHLGYKGVLSKYRFYGRNLLEMIQGVKDMEEGEIRDLYLNYIASFMVNSSKNWNDEELTPNQVVQHLADLTDGKLQLDPESFNIHIEIRKKRPAGNSKSKNFSNKKKKSNNNNRFKRR